MHTPFRYIMPLALVLTFSIAASAAIGASIKAAMDSSHIVMGQQTAVKLDIVEPISSQCQLGIDQNEFPTAVEIVGWVEGDTTDLGNGLHEIKRALVVQSFDSGDYVLPEFVLISGADTVRSNTLALKVVPVDVSAMEDINPLAPVAKFHSKWYDFMPDWLTEYWAWYLLALLVIAGGVCAWLIMSRKVKVNILPQKKRLPPDVIAIKRLTALKDEHLWENGQEKEYYTRLIDILRDYLQERFGINAMEMTSSQILRALQDNSQTRLPRQYMQRVVEIADYVKFAKVRPLPDDNVSSLRNAMQFIEETRPIPEPEQGEGGSSSDTSTASATAHSQEGDITNTQNKEEQK